MRKIIYKLLVVLFVCTLTNLQAQETKIPKVGDLYGGGIVCWTTPDGSEGLIVALNDVSSGTTWGFEETLINTKSKKGMENSKKIAATPKVKKSSPAMLCLNYDAGGFNDWYLPSDDELKKVIRANEKLDPVFTKTKNAEPMASDVYYWSSTEGYKTMAIGYDGRKGGGGSQMKTSKLRVRAVRSYTVKLPPRKPIVGIADTYKGGKAQIGQFYKGGIIVFVDSTGEHGLLASVNDVHVGTQWGFFGVKTNVRDEDGMVNTKALVAHASVTPKSAAKLCYDYKANNEGGWYLPSKQEFKHLSRNDEKVDEVLKNDGNPLTTPLINERYYWTSTEKGYSKMATGLSGQTGNGGTQYKEKYLAVRAFKKF